MNAMYGMTMNEENNAGETCSMQCAKEKCTVLSKISE